MHGGANGSGAPTGNQNALKRDYIREAEKLLKDLEGG
jgi:hypothetical protein